MDNANPHPLLSISLHSLTTSLLTTTFVLIQWFRLFLFWYVLYECLYKPLRYFLLSVLHLQGHTFHVELMLSVHLTIKVHVFIVRILIWITQTNLPCFWNVSFTHLIYIFWFNHFSLFNFPFTCSTLSFLSLCLFWNHYYSTLLALRV